MQEIMLPDKTKKIINEFVEQLEGAYGDCLVSIILYGSAASGEYALRHSNINIAVILKDASLGSLSKISRLINKRKFLIINPVFLTEDYIRHSTDSFPIEFTDMKENHAILHGKDVLKGIVIDIKNLRFQCEQELKSKIINIKMAYLRATNSFFLKKLLFKSLTSSIHVLRNLIRLKGKVPPYGKEEALNQISREFGIDVAALQAILDARSKNLNLNRKKIDNLYTRLVETLEAISDKIDQL
jgi:predicted nucleotidyltransferase